MKWWWVRLKVTTRILSIVLDVRREVCWWVSDWMIEIQYRGIARMMWGFHGAFRRFRSMIDRPGVAEC
jgi:hypothetical protein